MNVPDALDSGGDNTFIPAAETAPIEPEFAPQPLHAPVDVPAHFQPPAAPAPPAIEPNIPNVVPDAPNAHSSYSLFHRLQHLVPAPARAPRAP